MAVTIVYLSAFHEQWEIKDSIQKERDVRFMVINKTILRLQTNVLFNTTVSFSINPKWPTCQYNIMRLLICKTNRKYYLRIFVVVLNNHMSTKHLFSMNRYKCYHPNAVFFHIFNDRETLSVLCYFVS